MTEKKIIKGKELDGLSLETKLSLDEMASKHSTIAGQTVVKKSTQNLAEQQQSILQKAEKEAQEIKAKARALLQQVNDKIKTAQEKAYQEGREEGLASVTEILTRVKNEHEKMLENLEHEAVELVFEIAKKVIGDAFKTSKEAVLNMVKQALTASMGDKITILLHPDDYKELKDKKNYLLNYCHGSQVLNLKPAQTVKKGACLIESELGSIEADLEIQLKAIQKALGLLKDE